MTTLSKEEKIQIINSHLKNKAYSKYNLELDDLQEKAKSIPSVKSTEAIILQMIEIDKQIEVLNAKMAEVSALTE